MSSLDKSPLFEAIWLKRISFFALLVLIIFPVFGHLSSFNIFLWDESRVAVNALEMYYNGNYLVTHYLNKPDLWNTKPPLMIWLQCTLMHVFGPGELAVRLPSAMAGLFTFLSIIGFSHSFMKKFWMGFFATLLLITSSPYILGHCLRSGDYDALMIFFMVFYCLSFFVFVETGRTKWLYFSAAAVFLSILTKGVAGPMFLPALAIYLLFQKNRMDFFRNRHLYIAACGVLILSAGWFFVRELASPGYIDAYLTNDTGRFGKTIEGHIHPYYYYLEQLFDPEQFNWAWFSVAGLLAGLLFLEKRMRRFTAFLSLCIITYLIFISISATKTYWYEAPLYPFMALAGGILFISFSVVYEKVDRNQKVGLFILNLGLVVYLFYLPYDYIIRQTQTNGFTTDEVQFLPKYLKEVADGKRMLENPVIVSNINGADLVFYQTIIRRKINPDIRIKKSWEIEPGDKVTLTKRMSKNLRFNMLFELGGVHSDGNIQFFTVGKKRVAPDISRYKKGNAINSKKLKPTTP